MEPEAARTPRTRMVSMRALTVAVVVAFLIALCISGYLITRSAGGFQGFASTLFMPLELRHATFIGVADGAKPTPTFYTIESLGFVSTRPLHLFDPTRAPDDNFFVRSHPVASTTQVGDEYQPSKSHVTLTYLKNGRPAESMDLGIGSAPFVIDGAHIGSFTPSGVAVTSLPDHTQVNVHVGNDVIRISPAVLMSPDRTLIAWYDYTWKTEDIARVSATGFTKLGTIHDKLTQPVLSNTGLYDVRVGTNGTEVWLYAPTGGEGRDVLTIPAPLHIVRITF